MNKIQYIELLALRGIHELNGKSIAQAVRDSGGPPTDFEMALVNESAMKYYINKFQEANKTIEEQEKTINKLTKKVEDSEQDVEFLNALRELGVDNWSGYSQACDIIAGINDDGPTYFDGDENHD